ncbi:MAG: (E)-4-hydroxy-3-methylbut-2-enyl-diphosphate synthase [Deltaproteobacteria bacterium]|nr:(E)-4-hydroxy-3-methylbut-2-enyl-diphosphate synthase [Deltaproteobacteria bacterium]
MSYTPSLFQYQRRKTRVVQVGNVGIGGDNPIRVQSMTISDTLNTEAVVKEAVGLIEAGCEIVRITAPTIHHAENLKNIRDALRAQGYNTPLVADIHFTPQAAMIAADYVDKVRINPGNFADRKLFAIKEYSDAEYDDELIRIKEKFIPLVLKCKERGVAMRIGTNHGSLSDRIMNRYGDSPLGMVESALEFLRIAAEQNYHELVLSMKASNTQVMVQAYRMLVERMDAEGLEPYPLHLGVTEAGDGEDGRIKSAVGIMTLLQDGIGDTIRVSLTEDAIHEIPVAREMVGEFNEGRGKMGDGRRETGDGRSFTHFPLPTSHFPPPSWNPLQYCRRPSETVKAGPIYLSGKHLIRVQYSLPWEKDEKKLQKLEQDIAELIKKDRPPEIISFQIPDDLEAVDSFLEYAAHFKKKFSGLALGVALQEAPHLFPQIAPAVDKVSICPSREKTPEGWKAQAIEMIRIAKQLPLALEWRMEEGERGFALLNLAQLSQQEGLDRFGLCWSGVDMLHVNRALAASLAEKKIEAVLHLVPHLQKEEDVLIRSAGQLGALLLDGMGDSIEVGAPLAAPLRDSINLSYNILQAARQRVTKTEFIACPSCGRTMFDLQTTTARIKKITSHLKGVKIAIMGCIVNGPGEMADADFGYVGGGPNKIHLYVGKECVEKNIPQEIADERLVELIKAQGRWMEPFPDNDH